MEQRNKSVIEGNICIEMDPARVSFDTIRYGSLETRSGTRLPKGKVIEVEIHLDTS